MRYKAEQFGYDPRSKVYSQEISTLQSGSAYGVLPSGAHGIILQDSELTAEFAFTGADYDASGEDIAGWNFAPTMATVRRHPHLAGTHVLIIND